jgi:hypothetical protein
MKIQVGAGNVSLDGFRNVDVRPSKGVHIVDDATSLRSLADGSVEILFGNAVFEHFYLGRHLAALRRWKELLQPDGLIVMTGLPDFRMIAQLYLAGASGIVGSRFDLFNAYRYTHGHPEHATRAASREWQPNGSAPPEGYVPQLHKCLLDAGYMRDLFAATGLAGAIFNHAYPGEPHALNLGFLAAREPLADPSLEGVRHMLRRIPTIETMVTLDSVTFCPLDKPSDEMLVQADDLDSRQPPTLWQEVRWFLRKHFGGGY